MCWFNDEDGAPVSRMDFALFEKIIADLSHRIFKPRLHFSGHGEPLVYSEFKDVIKLCAARKIKWSITSNAYLLEGYAEDIVANGCSGINISLHGDQDLHYQTTGVKDAYKRVLSGLIKLEDAKLQLGSSNPPVAINCVINNNNVLYLRKILDSFLELPVNSITFQHLIFTQADLFNQASFLIASDDQLNALADFVQEVQQTKYPKRVNFFPRVKVEKLRQYYTDRAYPGKRDCIFPWLSTRIYPDGSMSACGPLWGNIISDPLTSVLNSQLAVQFRNSVKSGEFSSPNCFRYCHQRYD